MPIGIVAGKSEYMDAFDGGQWQFGDGSWPEAGVTFFAGTFVRHPLALAAAKATLEHLKAAGPRLQAELNARTTAFVQTINADFNAAGVPDSACQFRLALLLPVRAGNQMGQPFVLSFALSRRSHLGRPSLLFVHGAY